MERGTPVLIAPIQALARLIPPEVFLSASFTIDMETRVRLEELAVELVNMGYQRWIWWRLQLSSASGRHCGYLPSDRRAACEGGAF